MCPKIVARPWRSPSRATGWLRAAPRPARAQERDGRRRRSSSAGSFRLGREGLPASRRRKARRCRTSYPSHASRSPHGSAWPEARRRLQCPQCRGPACAPGPSIYARRRRARTRPARSPHIAHGGRLRRGRTPRQVRSTTRAHGRARRLTARRSPCARFPAASGPQRRRAGTVPPSRTVARPAARAAGARGEGHARRRSVDPPPSLRGCDRGTGRAAFGAKAFQRFHEARERGRLACQPLALGHDEAARRGSDHHHHGHADAVERRHVSDARDAGALRQARGRRTLVATRAADQASRSIPLRPCFGLRVLESGQARKRSGKRRHHLDIPRRRRTRPRRA